MIICYEILTSETNSLKNFKDLDIFRLPELLNTVYLLFKKVQSIKAEKEYDLCFINTRKPSQTGVGSIKRIIFVSDNTDGFVERGAQCRLTRDWLYRNSCSPHGHSLTHQQLDEMSLDSYYHQTSVVISYTKGFFHVVCKG